MKKFYISNENELNSEELKTGHISYKRLVDRICENRVLCNKVQEIDSSIWDNVCCGTIEDVDIYQFFLVNLNSWDLEYAKELSENNDIIISYSDMLDVYVLMVDHFGTSWDYVMTDIEWSTDLEECR